MIDIRTQVLHALLDLLRWDRRKALPFLELLTEAEELTRPLPLHQPDLIHGSQLVVDLCDLIREARCLGY